MRASADRPVGIVFVVSGPSGSGKGTVIKPIRDAAAELRLDYSVSHTTRGPRPTDGENDYEHVTRERFLAEVERGEFLECACYAGNHYGTPRGPVDAARREGRDILLEVEVRGAGLIRAQVPDAVLILLIAPSHAALLARLRRRMNEELRRDPTDAELAPRVASYRGELSGWSLYDYVIVNDDQREATADLLAIIRAERLRCRRMDVRGYIERNFDKDAEPR